MPTAAEQVALALEKRTSDRFRNLDNKLDGIHTSLKDDLTEIKADLTITNATVTHHDRSIAKLQGGLIVLGAGLPVVTGLLVYFIENAIR